MSPEPLPQETPFFDRDLHLAELVNRVLDRGAVITGEVTISVAGIDLVFLGLQLVISSAETAYGRRLPPDKKSP